MTRSFQLLFRYKIRELIRGLPPAKGSIQPFRPTACQQASGLRLKTASQISDIVSKLTDYSDQNSTAETRILDSRTRVNNCQSMQISAQRQQLAPYLCKVPGSRKTLAFPGCALPWRNDGYEGSNTIDRVIDEAQPRTMIERPTPDLSCNPCEYSSYLAAHQHIERQNNHINHATELTVHLDNGLLAVNDCERSGSFRSNEHGTSIFQDEGLAQVPSVGGTTISQSSSVGCGHVPPLIINYDPAFDFIARPPAALPMLTYDPISDFTSVPLSQPVCHYDPILDFVPAVSGHELEF